MSLLARFRVLTKIIAVVMLLSALAVGITWLGVNAMRTLNSEAASMESAAKRALRPPGQLRPSSCLTAANMPPPWTRASRTA